MSPHPAPTHLVLEHLPPGQPSGTRRPRGSWWLPAAASIQYAYAVRVTRAATGATVWESARRRNVDSVLVDLDVPALDTDAGTDAVLWQVKVWTDLGESAWSAPAPWSVAPLPRLLDTAVWIEPHEPVVAPWGERPAYRLRHEFDLAAPAEAATAWATAHGVYELFVNGERVGDLELTPGFTAYRSRLQVQPYDLTDHLRVGANSVELVLSDGWFRGRHGFTRAADGFGERVAALLAAHIRLRGGHSVHVTTGEGWWSRPSRITAADLMDGQRTDLRRPEPEGAGTDGWHRALPARGGLYDNRARLQLGVAPPVRRVAELAPVRVDRLADGTTVVDFGQNVNGWIRLADLGPAGCELTLTHAEHLDEDGRVDTEHLRPFDFATGHKLPAGQVDTVVSAGRPGEVFEPRHTTHGFRYVQVEGHPGPLSPESLTAVVVHTDLRETGWFRCGDDRLNALHRAAVWSFRGNACDIPTDCPQRERSGFSGDWQVYVATAALTHDVAGFSDKWLRDLAADQWPDGRITTISPRPAGAEPSGNPFTDCMEGSAGWGDAAVIVPWELWRAYGDLDLLRRQYPSMTRWVDYAAARAREHRHPDRARRHPVPEAHEEYLWDTGGHFGEWLEPGEVPTLDPDRDQGVVATAYLARSAELLGRIAALLGRERDARHYRDLARGARGAWGREYLRPDGSLTVPTQANHVRALAFGLVPERLRGRVARGLHTLVESTGHHLGTGFLSTGLLLPALADAGYLDDAYRVLLSNGAPSWLEMVNRGATTLWEEWEGVRDGKAGGSLNHYAKGAAVSFLHTHVAGIRLPENPGPDAAAYRRFRVQPQPGGGLTWAEAEHHSPYGPVRSAWSVDADRMRLTVDVPGGTRAEVCLPDGRVLDVGPGTHVFTDVPVSPAPPRAGTR